MRAAYWSYICDDWKHGVSRGEREGVWSGLLEALPHHHQPVAVAEETDVPQQMEADIQVLINKSNHIISKSNQISYQNQSNQFTATDAIKALAIMHNQSHTVNVFQIRLNYQSRAFCKLTCAVCSANVGTWVIFMACYTAHIFSKCPKN